MSTSKVSAESAARMALARSIAPVYTKNSNVQCVFTCASIVHGWGDEFSDIELVICCTIPPSDAERRAAAESAGGIKCRLGSYNPHKWTWPEEYEVGGIKIDTA